MPPFPRARFVRLAETTRPAVPIEIDGVAATALEGDTVLTALLTHGGSVRELEFGGTPRAGFCLMGACQDCWVWTPEGRRLRACTTTVTPGLRVVTRTGGSPWPSRA